MDPLTLRENDVAQLVASGLSNQEIGRILKISEQTVKNHLQSIFRKLALENRVELTLRLRQHHGGRRGINTKTAMLR